MLHFLKTIMIEIRYSAPSEVEGSTDCLEAFASFFDFAAADKKGAHSHYEYYAGNGYISPESVLLVISLK